MWLTECNCWIKIHLRLIQVRFAAIIVNNICRTSIIYRPVVLNLFEVREHFWLYEKFAERQN